MKEMKVSDKTYEMYLERAKVEGESDDETMLKMLTWRDDCWGKRYKKKRDFIEVEKILEKVKKQKEGK